MVKQVAEINQLWVKYRDIISVGFMLGVVHSMVNCTVRSGEVVLSSIRSSASWIIIPVVSGASGIFSLVTATVIGVLGLVLSSPYVWGSVWWNTVCLTTV